MLKSYIKLDENVIQSHCNEDKEENPDDNEEMVEAKP